MAAAAAATAVLRPHVPAVVTKTPTGTAMAGKQTTINNQLKAAAATATETATMTATKENVTTKTWIEVTVMMTVMSNGGQNLVSHLFQVSKCMVLITRSTKQFTHCHQVMAIYIPTTPPFNLNASL
jgi:hypothetical protein